MPSVFPPFLKSSIPKSEFAVYRALRNNLSDDWLVIYSPRWTKVQSDGRLYSCEADFLVFHPNHGMLLIEVKGGGIKYLPEADEWFTTNSAGEENLIKDPFEQAQGNLLSVVKTLRQQQDMATLPVTYGHAIIFTSMRDLSDLSHPQNKGGIVATANELPFIEDWIVAVLDGWKGASAETLKPTAEFAELLKNTFVPALNIQPQLGADIATERLSFQELSHEQFDLLDGLHAVPNVAVRGGAGTGKTILAMKKALNLALSGVPTLLTCYNKALAKWMAARLQTTLDRSNQGWLIKSGMLTISNLHNYAISKLDLDNENLDWDAVPALLKERMVAEPEEFVRAIIIDEGQDFGSEWWQVIRELQVKQDPILWVFYDPNQSIYQSEDEVAKVPDMVPFELTRNFRNTKSIHNELMPLFEGKALTATGPDGRPPEIIKLATGQSTIDVVSEVVKKLVGSEGIPAHEIAILTPTRKHSELFVKEIAGIKTQNSGSIELDKLIVETIFSFKGQERPVIILCEMHKQEYADVRRLRYTAISRASHHLIEIDP
ncbi:MAG: AAA family ATPase [Planctomycetota bacterium]|nr:AAA family ATPase [Planctomycetota bacterium]